MWKKSIGQATDLTEYIEKSNNEPKCIGDFVYDKHGEESFIEIDDAVEEESSWDPNIAPKIEWTSKKMSFFLQYQRSKVPLLIQIIQKQENPHYGNPSFLCKFQAIDGEVQIWMSSVRLYHTKAYNEIYKAYVEKNSMSN